jgi:hypothetical protein
MKENNRFDSLNVTRRRTLQVIGAGVVAPAALAACAESKTESHSAPKKKEEKKPAPTPAAAASKPSTKPDETAAAAAPAGGKGCDGEIDATSANLRKTLQYVENSKIEGKQCKNCAQWIKPEGDNACGGCKLFTGPVQPSGYCLSWAAAKA